MSQSAARRSQTRRLELDSSAKDLIHQDLDALVGWMMNGGPERLRAHGNMKLRLNLSTSPHENKRPFLAAAGVAGAPSG